MKPFRNKDSFRKSENSIGAQLRLIPNQTPIQLSTLRINLLYVNHRDRLPQGRSAFSVMSIVMLVLQGAFSLRMLVWTRVFERMYMNQGSTSDRWEVVQYESEGG